jgi:hypothetical protein
LVWANTLKETGGGTRYQPLQRSGPGNLPRPSSSSVTPVRSPARASARRASPRHSPAGARASSFTLEKSPQRFPKDKKQRSRSCSPRQDRDKSKCTTHHVSPSPARSVGLHLL